MLAVSARTSVVKTIIAVIFSPSVYRKQTLPSCPLPVAENRQTKQMSKEGRAVPGVVVFLERGQAPRGGEGAMCENGPPFSVLVSALRLSDRELNMARESSKQPGVFLNPCSRPFADSVT